MISTPDQGVDQDPTPQAHPLCPLLHVDSFLRMLLMNLSCGDGANGQLFFRLVLLLRCRRSPSPDGVHAYMLERHGEGYGRVQISWTRKSWAGHWISLPGTVTS